MGLPMHKSKKGHNSTMSSRTDEKKILVHLFFMSIPYVKFQDPSTNHSLVFHMYKA